MEAKRAVLFGAGTRGAFAFKKYRDLVEIIAIADNDSSKWGARWGGIEVVPPRAIKKLAPDRIIVASMQGAPEIYQQLLQIGFSKEQIIFEDCSPKKKELPWYEKYSSLFHTRVGKHSSGPICCDHPLIESIGAFCSFAEGVCVHGNHGMQYVSTHPFLYKGSPNDPIEGVMPYEEYHDASWYVEGVHPKGKIEQRRIHIGNDVWLGRNVVIVNYANIGNGVIAGAGAIITKDVPDYAVVIGVPARIVKYRYKPDQIKALNQIKWWAWDDEKIRERFDDFYLGIDDFIEKYATED